MKGTRPIFIGILIAIVLIGSALGGALADRLFVIKPLDAITKRVSPTTASTNTSTPSQMQTSGLSVVDIADKVSPSVVTVSITQQQQTLNPSMMDPFGMFGIQQPSQQSTKTVQQDIGSGFVVEKSGLIVTNKHVVSITTGKYKIITSDNKEYDVQHIYRDPANDLAILQVSAELPAVDLGDSSTIKVGQSVIAIGTALGEFRHTVTTGVISGLGRGITAGDEYSGYAERLDNVIQTDAAINPGNSGGPLLDGNGRVIGVNVAVAQGAQNVAFALPINVIKDSLQNFNDTGKFSRPFVGVQYRFIPKQTALLNDVPAGAYVVQVVAGSPAEKAGLQAGDIITKFDGQDLTNSTDETSFSTLISKKKVGDQVLVEYIRNNNRQTVTLTLAESGE